MPPRSTIGVIVDRMTLARWQAEALRALGDEYDLLIYSCGNSRPDPRRLRHALYYLLNLFTIRNRLTRRIALPANLAIVARREFDAEQDGAWQRLPADMLARIRSDSPAAIVKFGMGLLSIPPDDELGIPILSYHHGDPACFRGRPAGFYEMLNGLPTMGQVVQLLSNALDSGAILASAETKVLPHSYRATLLEAYRHSPLILARALDNTLAGESVTPAQWGTNYRLPGNWLVMRFLVKQWRRAASRLVYGLFKEKLWGIATVSVGDDLNLDSIEQALDRTAEWRTIATPAGYRFLADPFFHPDRGLLVEALNARSCRGEILWIDEASVVRLSGAGGHYSYPASVKDANNWYVVPETSDWSPPRAFPLSNDGLGEPVELKIAGGPSLLDPTPFDHDGKIYLFGNVTTEGASVLRLWVSEGLRGQFVEHPSSPIRISPNGARMAGSLCRVGPKLFRFGQDFRRGYGDGLTLFEITHIDDQHYSEQPVGGLRFAHCRGPHTLNLGQAQAAFDFYAEHFSLLAGIRRWRDRRAARRTD